MKLAVLISGNGSNLQAIIDSIQAGELQAEIKMVISNRADAYGITRAKQASIQSTVIDSKQFTEQNEFEAQIISILDQQNIDLIVLAGFMKILSKSFVNRYLGKLINIHPSLLPKYQGLNTHKRVLDAGDDKHGATVHFVIPELDSGPIILQATVPVLKDDDQNSLANRVHKIEHLIYPEAIRRLCSGQLRFRNGAVEYENKPITTEQQQYNSTELS